MLDDRYLTAGPQLHHAAKLPGPLAGRNERGPLEDPLRTLTQLLCGVPAPAGPAPSARRL